MSNRSEHDDILLNTAVPLKMGDLNTPSVIQFFKKHGGFECYFKTAIERICTTLPQNNGFVFAAA
ncbi:MAG: hypothetical protein WA116_08930 [Anaerolineaceae bacterium]